MILSRMSLVMQLLSDTESNTEKTILACSYIVTSIIAQYGSLCAEDATVLSTIKALSSVIRNGKKIPAFTAYNISNAIDEISAARGLQLSAGENTTIATDVLRVTTIKAFLSIATHTVYSCPQTALEIFVKAPVTIASFNEESGNRHLILNSSKNTGASQSAQDNGANGDLITVSLSLSTISYRGINRPNSTAERIQLYFDSYSSSLYTVTAVVPNLNTVHYYDEPPSILYAACEPRGSPYNIPGNCTTAPDLQIKCPGNDSRVVQYTCPGRQLIPTCVAWNGSDYVKNSACTVISYTGQNTTCACVGSTNNDGSLSTNPQIDDLAASTKIVLYGFAETWSSAANVNQNSFVENKVRSNINTNKLTLIDFLSIQVITLVVIILLIFFAVGFIGLSLTAEIGYSNQMKSMSYKRSMYDNLKPFTFYSEAFSRTTLTKDDSYGLLNRSGILISKENAKLFFKSILPLELSLQAWYLKFWIRALEYHPILGLLTPARGRKYFHTTKWLSMSLKVLNILFVNAIFAPIASPSGNTCSKFTSSIECLQPSSIDLIDSLCHWNEALNRCEYVTITENVGVIIITGLIIQIACQPLMIICRYLVSQIAHARRLNRSNQLSNSFMTRSIHPNNNRSVSSGSDGYEHVQRISKSSMSSECKYDSIINIDQSIAPPLCGGSAKVSPEIVQSSNIDTQEGCCDDRASTTSCQDTIDGRDSGMEDEGIKLECTVPMNDLFIRIERAESELCYREGIVSSSSDDLHDTARTQELYNRTVIMNRSVVSDSSDDEGCLNIRCVSMSRMYDGNYAIHRHETSNSREESKDHNVLNVQECLSSRSHYHSAHMFSQKQKNFIFLIRLSAKLLSLRRNIDDIAVDQEVDYLVNQLDPRYKSDTIEYALHVMRPLSKGRKTNSNMSTLLGLIQEARLSSGVMLNVMSKMTSDYEKEVYLAKKFILGSLRGVHKLVAQRFLFDEEELEVSALYGFVCFTVLVLYVTASLAYVFLAASSMGKNAANLWLSCIALVIFQGESYKLADVNIFFFTFVFGK